MTSVVNPPFVDNGLVEASENFLCFSVSTRYDDELFRKGVCGDFGFVHSFKHLTCATNLFGGDSGRAMWETILLLSSNCFRCFL